jgi:hypothetical protein
MCHTVRHAAVPVLHFVCNEWRSSRHSFDAAVVGGDGVR